MRIDESRTDRNGLRYVGRRRPRRARAEGSSFRYTDRDLGRLRGRTVALRTAYGCVVGRLGLGARAGEVSWEVQGVYFTAEAVRSLRDGDVLPVAVLR